MGVTPATKDWTWVRQRRRPGRNGDGASFRVDAFSRYLLHDVADHDWGRR